MGGSSSSQDCVPACENGAVCNAGACQCPELDADICARLDFNCGPATVTDVCGLQRVVDCGVCNGVACGPNNTCLPQCSTINVDPATYTLLTDLSYADQDVLAASNGDGSVVVVLRPQTGQQCLDPFSLWVGLGSPALSWTLVDFTASVANLFLLGPGSEQGFAVLSDGVSNFIVGVDPNLHLALFDLTNGVPASGPLDEINAWLDTSSRTFLDGVAVSGDGLALALRVTDGQGNAVNHLSERTSVLVPFPPPNVLGDLRGGGLGNYVVTGFSADRLTVFLMSNFVTFMVHRDTLARAFVNPNPGNDPPLVPGFFRVQPLPGCNELLANTTAAGCFGEDVVTVNARFVTP